MISWMCIKVSVTHTAVACEPTQKADFQAAHTVQNTIMVISPLAEKEPH